MSPPNKSISPQHIARPRVTPLSVLPVFFNLQDAPVLVVGNSEAIAWKAELLLAAGAHIKLVGQDPHQELQDIIDSMLIMRVMFRMSNMS